MAPLCRMYGCTTHRRANLGWGVGTYLGQGGPGSFVNLVSSVVELAKFAFSWRFTRLTGHHMDNAQLANGYMVLNKDGAPRSQQSKP